MGGIEINIMLNKMEELLVLITFALFIYMILVLIKPKKFMPFTNVSNGVKRILSISIWIMACIIADNASKTANTHNPQAEKEYVSVDSTSNIINNQIKAARGDSADLAEGNVFNVGANATADDIIIQAALYATYTANTDTITNPTLKALKIHNSKAAKKLWAKKSPLLRKKYANILKEQFWEHDIDVKTTNGGKDIWFIGGIFASHKNIKDFEAQAEENLTALGFHRVHYKWVDSEYAESTYYNLN